MSTIALHFYRFMSVANASKSNEHNNIIRDNITFTSHGAAVSRVNVPSGRDVVSQSELIVMSIIITTNTTSRGAEIGTGMEKVDNDHVFLHHRAYKLDRSIYSMKK